MIEFTNQEIMIVKSAMSEMIIVLLIKQFPAMLMDIIVKIKGLEK